jgi:Na+-driven multidrug efflux pump
LITASTLARLVALTGIVLGLVVVLRLPGAAAGALALTTGVGMEAFMIRAPVRRRFATFTTPPPVASLPEPVTPRRILKFVFPLMLNQAAWSSQRAVISAAISRLDDPFLALASFGVVHPLFFFMDSPLFSLQSVVQVLSRTRRDLMRLAAYTVSVSTALGVIATMLAFTWGRAILTSGYGLDPRLAQEALPALLWIGLAPVLSGLRAYGQGVLLRIGRTGPLTVSSLLRVATVAVAAFLLVALLPDWNGALLGAWLILLGDGCDVVVALGWGLTHLEGMNGLGPGAPEAGGSEQSVRG